MTPKEVKPRIDAVLALCHVVTKMVGKFGSDEHRKADDAFWDACTALDKDAKISGNVTFDGTTPGRLLRFSVGDGYAYYFIEKVLKNHVKVIHIPYGDAYQSPAVNRDGEADKMTVEDMIQWTDELLAAAKSEPVKELA